MNSKDQPQASFPADSQWYESVPCNLCGSDDFFIKYHPTVSDFDPASVFSASGGIMGTQQIVVCKKCGLCYVNPRIKSQKVIEGYREAPDELYTSQAAGREATFRRCLRILEKYVSPAKGRLLDVGCAAGFFVKAAAENGWDAEGIEPSKWLTDYGKARGLKIRQGTLRDAGFPKDCFDAVTLWDVLEHVSDPKAELREANRILKPGGVILINYPDIGSLLARLAGSRWWFLLSVHLYYFNRKTIAKLLEAAGFQPVAQRRHFQVLALGHLVKMVGLYNKTISRLALRCVEALRMSDWPIPYYASQVNVIAKKR